MKRVNLSISQLWFLHSEFGISYDDVHDMTMVQWLSLQIRCAVILLERKPLEYRLANWYQYIERRRIAKSIMDTESPWSEFVALDKKPEYPASRYAKPQYPPSRFCDAKPRSFLVKGEAFPIRRPGAEPHPVKVKGEAYPIL